MDTIPANHYSRFERYTVYATFTDGSRLRWCGTDSRKWAGRDKQACQAVWSKQAPETFSGAVIDTNPA